MNAETDAGDRPTPLTSSNNSSITRVFSVVDICSVWISFLEVGDIVGLSSTCQVAHRLCSAANRAIWVPLASRLMLDLVGAESLQTRIETRAVIASALATASSNEQLLATQDGASSGDGCLKPPARALLSMRSLLAESDALLRTYLSLLHRVVNQCAQACDDSVDGSGISMWPKRVALRLSSCGFETFSYQVRTLRAVASALLGTAVPSSTVPQAPATAGNTVVARQAFRVIERLLQALTHYQSMRATEVGDHESVQEIVVAVGNSMEEAMEHLKPLFKGLTKHSNPDVRRLSRVVLELKRQCGSLSSSVTVASWLAEVNDHPDAQAKYDSLWAVYRAVGQRRVDTSMPSTPPPVAAPSLQQQGGSRAASPLDAATMMLLIPLEEGKYSACLTELQLHRLRSIRLVRVADIADYFFRMPKFEQDSFKANVWSLYRLTVAAMEGSDIGEN